MAFLYLFNALVDDIELGIWVPSTNYPEEAPAYLTITMRAVPNFNGSVGISGFAVYVEARISSLHFGMVRSR